MFCRALLRFFLDLKNRREEGAERVLHWQMLRVPVYVYVCVQ